MMHRIDALILLLVEFLAICSGIPCEWNMDRSGEETKEMNCGFLCENPWGADDPHSCGAPHPCCCDAECRHETHHFVGINWSDKYGRMTIPRSEAFSVLKQGGFNHIKTFSPDGLRDIVDAFGVEHAHIYVGVPNRELANIVDDPDYAVYYVETFLKPWEKNIRMVIVGNEPLLCIRTAAWFYKGECGSLNIPVKLLPAMKAIYNALVEQRMVRPLTTAFNGGILEMSTNPWTPCVSDFKSFLKPILEPIWEFLRITKSPFIVNIYSWFASMGGHIPPTNAVGYPTEHIPFDGKYEYIFNYDMQIDMQRVAMCRNGITDLELMIGETGWPSGDHDKANLTNAVIYTHNVVERAQGRSPYPDHESDNIRFKNVPYSVFLFQAFDEDKKFEIEHGNRFENHFGLYYEDGSPKWTDKHGNIIFNIPGKEEGPAIIAS